MKHCAICFIDIPEKQNICSICANNVDHGTDGYLRSMLAIRKVKKEPRDAQWYMSIKGNPDQKWKGFGGEE